MAVSVRCFCDAFWVSEDAPYVKNGKPMCNSATCQQVLLHRAQNLHEEKDGEGTTQA